MAVSDEVKEDVLAVFAKKARIKQNLSVDDIAKGLKIKKREAKKIVTELVKAEVLEFTSYGGATFIKVIEKE